MFFMHTATICGKSTLNSEIIALSSFHFNVQSTNENKSPHEILFSHTQSPNHRQFTDFYEAPFVIKKMHSQNLKIIIWCIHKKKVSWVSWHWGPVPFTLKIFTTLITEDTHVTHHNASESKKKKKPHRLSITIKFPSSPYVLWVVFYVNKWSSDCLNFFNVYKWNLHSPLLNRL